jgi:hypothetical protein
MRLERDTRTGNVSCRDTTSGAISLGRLCEGGLQKGLSERVSNEYPGGMGGWRNFGKTQALAGQDNARLKFF